MLITLSFNLTLLLTHNFFRGQKENTNTPSQCWTLPTTATQSSVGFNRKNRNQNKNLQNNTTSFWKTARARNTRPTFLTNPEIITMHNILHTAGLNHRNEHTRSELNDTNWAALAIILMLSAIAHFTANTSTPSKRRSKLISNVQFGRNHRRRKMVIVPNRIVHIVVLIIALSLAVSNPQCSTLRRCQAHGGKRKRNKRSKKQYQAAPRIQRISNILLCNFGRAISMENTATGGKARMCLAFKPSTAWNSAATLISLSGDVHPHPGPTTEKTGEKERPKAPKRTDVPPPSADQMFVIAPEASDSVEWTERLLLARLARPGNDRTYTRFWTKPEWHEQLFHIIESLRNKKGDGELIAMIMRICDCKPNLKARADDYIKQFNDFTEKKASNSDNTGQAPVRLRLPKQATHEEMVIIAIRKLSEPSQQLNAMTELTKMMSSNPSAALSNKDIRASLLSIIRTSEDRKSRSAAAELLQMIVMAEQFPTNIQTLCAMATIPGLRGATSCFHQDANEAVTEAEVSNHEEEIIPFLTELLKPSDTHPIEQDTRTLISWYQGKQNKAVCNAIVNLLKGREAHQTEPTPQPPPATSPRRTTTRSRETEQAKEEHVPSPPIRSSQAVGQHDATSTLQPVPLRHPRQTAAITGAPPRASIKGVVQASSTRMTRCDSPAPPEQATQQDTDDQFPELSPLSRSSQLVNQFHESISSTSHESATAARRGTTVNIEAHNVRQPTMNVRPSSTRSVTIHVADQPRVTSTRTTAQQRRNSPPPPAQVEVSRPTTRISPIPRQTAGRSATPPPAARTGTTPRTSAAARRQSPIPRQRAQERTYAPTNPQPPATRPYVRVEEETHRSLDDENIKTYSYVPKRHTEQWVGLTASKINGYRQAGRTDRNNMLHSFLSLPKESMRELTCKTSSRMRRRHMNEQMSGAILEQTQEGGKRPQNKKTEDKRAVSACLRQLLAGNISKAAKILMRAPAAADYDFDKTVEDLERLHPMDSSHEADGLVLNVPGFPNLDDKDLVKAIRHCCNGAASGRTGWTPELLLPLSQDNRTKADLTELILDIINDRIHPANRDRLTACRLIALPKAKPGEEWKGVRPIACGEALLKVSATVVVGSVRPKLDDFFGGVQYGQGIKGGCEYCTHHISENWLKDRVCTVALDAANAFNTPYRKDIKEALIDHESIFSPFFGLWNLAYSKPSSLHFHRGKKDAIIQSQRGTRQGDVLGGLFFSLVIQKTLREAQEHFPLISIYAYLDDITLQSDDIGDLVRCTKFIENGLNGIGMRLNASKCEWSSQYDQQPPGLDNFMWRQDSIKILGVHHGLPDAVQAALERELPKHERYFDRLQLVKGTAFTTLLTACAAPRANFLIRTHNPDLTKSFTMAFDAMVVKAWSTFAKVEPTVATMGMATLPYKLGGCGWTSMRAIRHVAYSASYAFAFGAQGVPSQEAGTLSIMTELLESLERNAVHKLHLEQCRQTGTSRWYRSIKDVEYTMNNDEASAGIRMRLCAPYRLLQPDTHCVGCKVSLPLEEFNHHVRGCGRIKGQNSAHAHQLFGDELRQICRSRGVTVETGEPGDLKIVNCPCGQYVRRCDIEQHVADRQPGDPCDPNYLLSAKTMRPDLAVTFGSVGRVLIDYTFLGGATRTQVRHQTVDANFRVREEEKEQKYLLASNLQGDLFITFACTSVGSLSPQALWFCKTLVEASRKPFDTIHDVQDDVRRAVIKCQAVSLLNAEARHGFSTRERITIRDELPPEGDPNDGISSPHVLTGPITEQPRPEYHNPYDQEENDEPQGVEQQQLHQIEEVLVQRRFALLEEEEESCFNSSRLHQTHSAASSAAQAPAPAEGQSRYLPTIGQTLPSCPTLGSELPEPQPRRSGVMGFLFGRLWK
ncbi:MAG: hypothetical protein COA38_20315 [Fluviicola sp.]|nr:MAG: hypothetical protein COA38_20315 [Fluviicola sp.]